MKKIKMNLEQYEYYLERKIKLLKAIVHLTENEKNE